MNFVFIKGYVEKKMLYLLNVKLSKIYDDVQEYFLRNIFGHQTDILHSPTSRSFVHVSVFIFLFMNFFICLYTYLFYIYIFSQPYLSITIGIHSVKKTKSSEEYTNNRRDGKYAVLGGRWAKCVEGWWGWVELCSE